MMTFTLNMEYIPPLLQCDLSLTTVLIITFTGSESATGRKAILDRKAMPTIRLQISHWTWSKCSVPKSDLRLRVNLF